MRGRTALFYSVSGVAAASAWELYKVVRATLPSRFPSSTFAFLGNPFSVHGHRKFPLPLFWSEEERGWHPTTRVLNCWKRLNEFGVRKLRPALAEYDVVFTERLGFDGVMYATSFCDNPREIEEAERIHHTLVKMRIVEQGIAPPKYFIPVSDPSNVEHLTEKFPELEGVDPTVLREFMLHEERTLLRYFDPKNGQKTPVKLPLEMTIEEMCDEVIDIVGRNLAERAAA